MIFGVLVWFCTVIPCVVSPGFLAAWAIAVYEKKKYDAFLAEFLK